MTRLPKKQRQPSERAFSAATSESATSRETLADWSSLPGGVLDGGEIVLLAVKPSLWRPLFESAPWIVACALLAWAVTHVEFRLAGMSLAATIQLVIFVGFARLAWGLFRWVPRWYLLTNRRIMDVEGIREPKVWSCPLLEVRNTYLTANPAERVTSTGSICVVTEDERIPPRYWHSVPKPDQVHAAIRRAIEDAIDRHGHHVR